MRREIDPFFETREWQLIRYRVLRKYGFKCMACGLSHAAGAVLQVDHVKPRSRHPELALCEDNLQVLCKACNVGKSNIYEDDFRPEERPVIRVQAPKRLHRRPSGTNPKEWRAQRLITAYMRFVFYIKGKIDEAERKGDTLAQAKGMSSYLAVMRKVQALREGTPA